MPINSVPTRQEVTAEVLRVLYNNCATVRSMGRQHQKYFEQAVPIGTTLQIKRPWRPQGRTGIQFQPEPIVQTTVPLTISYVRGGDFIYNDTDEALFLDMENFHKNYSRPMGLQIAQMIDADALAFMQVTTPNFVGTPGTIPTTLDTYNSAQTQLNKLLAPKQDRSVIFTSDYNQKIVGLGQTLFNPQNEIGKQYLTGMVARYADFLFLTDEQLPAFTVGVYAGTPVVNGANQTGSSISIRGFTSSSTTLNPGDRITFAGVYKVNPGGARVAYNGSNALFQAVITQTATDAAGVLTAQIYPALIPSGQFQNASASPADGATVTIAGTTGQIVNTAFAFQEEAFTAAFVHLQKPSNVQVEVMGGAEADTPGVYIRSIQQWQSTGLYAAYQTDRMDVMYGYAAQYADYMATVIYG